MADKRKRGMTPAKDIPVCDTGPPDRKKRQPVCRLPEPAQPAQEWGQRHETGKAIARGGKSAGAVAGATDQQTAQAQVLRPAAPLEESPPEAVEKTQAIVDAAAHLGDQADPQRVADAVKAKTGIDIDLDEVAAILDALREQATPPPPEGTPERPSIEQLPERP